MSSISVASLGESRRSARLLSLLVLLVAIVCGLPMLRLALRAVEALAHGGGAVLFEPLTWRATANTLLTALVGTAISVLLGLAFALPTALADLRGRAALVLAFMLPMMIPPQITALAWIQLGGPASPLLNLLGIAPPLGSPQPFYSRSGIALLLGVQHAPLVFLAVRVGLAAIPRELVEAARLSGAGQVAVLRTVILPLARPGIVAGAAIAFISAVGNFGIPAMLGLPASIVTLPTLVYIKLASFGIGTLGDMALLSVLIAALAIAGLIVQARALKSRDYRIVGLSGGLASFRLGRWRLPLEMALWSVIALVLVAPFAALVTTSLLPTYGVRLSLQTASLAAYEAVLFRQALTVTAFRNSFLLAGAAAVILVAISLPLARWLVRTRSHGAGLVTALIEIPYALPGIVVAVACILLFAAPLPVIGISIYGTVWIILFAYLASFMAVGLKPISSAFLQLDPALEEAASLSGASDLRRLRDIALPLVAPAVGASAILVFLIAVNELTVSTLLWSAGTQTLGVAVFNLDDSGEANLAAALSVIVVVMIFILMLALDRLAGRMPRGAVPWRI